ncbi:unnamed protein product, partial [Prorocentrum cordatum]
VSRALRLHQHDCCALVEQALDLTANFAEVPHKCAAIFHRECHFQALVLHDMAQGLAQTPPARHSVAFFAMLGGPAFVRALLESLSLFLRDATGERSGDQMFLSHACAMIRLYAQTLLAYYYAFQASADEVEAVLSLLLHVVSAQHAPPSQGPSVSDLDLILREDHADISVKLCLALVCMCLPQVRGDEGKIDPGKLQQGATPTGIRVQDLLASRDAGGPLGPRGGRTPLGTKMQAGDYWNQESQLGQFLAFAISGVLLEDEQALRNGYVHWHTFHFLLHDILLSGTIISDTCTSHLVLKSVSALLARALLPVGRGWMAIKKLEARAVGYGMLAPDVLQISILQVLGRLCRVCPGACDSFWPVASYCTDNFHMSAPQVPRLAPLAPPLLALLGAGAFVGPRPAERPARRGPGRGAAAEESPEALRRQAEQLRLEAEAERALLDSRRRLQAAATGGGAEGDGRERLGEEAARVAEKLEAARKQLRKAEAFALPEAPALRLEVAALEEESAKVAAALAAPGPESRPPRRRSARRRWTPASRRPRGRPRPTRRRPR